MLGMQRNVEGSTAAAALLCCGGGVLGDDATDRHSLRVLVEAALSDLVNYYESDELLLEEFVRSGTTVHGRRLVRTALNKEKVVIAAIGSSVTAGHDTFGSTAWPAVLERRLRRVFEVEVRNQAVAGRTPFPASLCLRPIVGQDVDVIVREWEYWRFSDGLGGLDRRDLGSSSEDLFGARLLSVVARQLPKKPVVYFMQMDANGESAKTRQLVNAGGDNVVVASAFGKAFDHLRAKAPMHRTPRQAGHRRCSSTHVGECPLSPPDGHHNFPEWDGLGDLARDDVRELAKPAKLFINWHPGSIGHEVMGNQLAYHILKSMLSGLDDDHSEEKQTSTSLCAARICKHNISCAMTTRPVASGPSIGDLVLDRNTTLWRDSPTDAALERSRQCAKKPDCGQGSTLPAVRCYEWLRKCSYRDQRRGWTGSAASGPLRLSIPPTFFDRRSSSECLVYIFETGHEWSKPSKVANWHFEVEIEVDGEPCRACEVVQGRGDYVQGVRIDLSRHGGCGKRYGGGGNTDISVRAKPLASLAEFERSSGQPVCAVAKNGRCEPYKEWRRYDLRCRPSAPLENDGPSPSPSRCELGPKLAERPRSDAKVLVDSVVTF